MILNDKLSFSVHLTVLHLHMCLFRPKPYPMLLADQITKQFERRTLEMTIMYDLLKQIILIQGYMCLRF